MSVYKGYARFRKSKGTIIFRPDDFFPIDSNGHSALGHISKIKEKELIYINNKQILEEQVKTIIHELIHLGINEPSPQKDFGKGFPDLAYIPKEVQ